MDYRTVKKTRGSEKRHLPLTALTAVWLLVFIYLVQIAWPRGENFLRGILVTGCSGAAVFAVEELVQDLNKGIPLRDALEAFSINVAENTN